MRAAQAAAEERYNQTNLWEDRARLAAALQESETDQTDRRVEEVLRRGKHLSPFARLRLAEAMVRTMPDEAKQLAESCVQDLSEVVRILLSFQPVSGSAGPQAIQNRQRKCYEPWFASESDQTSSKN